MVTNGLFSVVRIMAIVAGLCVVTYFFITFFNDPQVSGGLKCLENVASCAMGK